MDTSNTPKKREQFKVQKSVTNKARQAMTNDDSARKQVLVSFNLTKKESWAHNQER